MHSGIGPSVKHKVLSLSWLIMANHRNSSVRRLTAEKPPLFPRAQPVLAPCLQGGAGTAVAAAPVLAQHAVVHGTLHPVGLCLGPAITKRPDQASR